MTSPTAELHLNGPKFSTTAAIAMWAVIMLASVLAVASDDQSSSYYSDSGSMGDSSFNGFMSSPEAPLMKIYHMTCIPGQLLYCTEDDDYSVLRVEGVITIILSLTFESLTNYPPPPGK